MLQVNRIKFGRSVVHNDIYFMMLRLRIIALSCNRKIDISSIHFSHITLIIYAALYINAKQKQNL